MLEGLILNFLFRFAISILNVSSQKTNTMSYGQLSFH